MSKDAALPLNEPALKIFLSSSCIGIFSSSTVTSSLRLEILMRWSIVMPLNAIQFFIGLTLFEMYDPLLFSDSSSVTMSSMNATVFFSPIFMKSFGSFPNLLCILPKRLNHS